MPDTAKVLIYLSVLYAYKVVINLTSVSFSIQKLFQFVGKLARVAASGGTILTVTWCHRDLLQDEESPNHGGRIS